jgi:hypothetical protein
MPPYFSLFAFYTACLFLCVAVLGLENVLPLHPFDANLFGVFGCFLLIAGVAHWLIEGDAQ